MTYARREVALTIPPMLRSLSLALVQDEHFSPAEVTLMRSVVQLLVDLHTRMTSGPLLVMVNELELHEIEQLPLLRDIEPKLRDKLLQSLRGPRTQGVTITPSE